MHPVITALTAALRDLREPRVLALALVPPVVAIAVWLALVWAFADDWARWVAETIATTAWLSWLNDWGLGSVFVWASGIAAFALLVPVMLVTAVLVTEILAMPVIVPLVGERHFPQLERRRGGTVAGSVWNAATTIVLFGVLWLVTLPLWLTGIGALVLPPLLSALFNERMFRYDALAEHAGAEEIQAVVRRAGGRLYALGLALAALYAVPFVNLLVPMLSGLAFTHLCLAELARLRARSS
ncbi:MAG TPA: EI24 domain-containing protein [Burkholderiales bacterium]|nr:EI24 domain-containing protein [Burkholderiales bacterium]